MNLNEKLAEAEKVAKANAKAKAEAEEKGKAQQKAKHDELMSRIEPAAMALKRFIEGAEGQAVIRFLRQAVGHPISLGFNTPTSLAFWRERLTEHYHLSAEGFCVKVSYLVGNELGKRERIKTRRATWSDYVFICRDRALKGYDPFCVIEEIKS